MTRPRYRVVMADDEPLARERLRRLLIRETEFQLVGEAEDGTGAVSLIRRHRPQVALLDVRLPGLDGFQILEELGSLAPPAVIFVTAHREYAVHAFEARVVDYLLKPFTPARFQQALQRARLRCSNGPAARIASLLAGHASTNGRIAVKSRTKRVLLSADEILCAIAANNRCRVTTTSAELEIDESLGSLGERLAGGQFVRISRFALVNLAYVLAIEPKSHGDQHLLLRNNRRLTVARTHRAKVLDRLHRTRATGRDQSRGSRAPVRPAQ